MLSFLTYPRGELGTPAVILAAVLAYAVGRRIIGVRNRDPEERYRKRQTLLLVLALVVLVALGILWAGFVKRTGTFLGLVGGGLAIALKEPLLALAGRVALLTGRAYRVGDRVQIEDVVGDVVDIGFVYTRLLEIGNWVRGDQATGRMVQFSNSKLFGATPVYNYTRYFQYIWDELVLPVTYDSNYREAQKLLANCGEEYTREFLSGAQQELEAMRRRFVLPELDLRPAVYMTVTSNWIALHLRYLVHPKNRRAAANFMWQRIFAGIRERDDIAIASSTSDVTVRMRSEGPPSAGS